MLELIVIVIETFVIIILLLNLWINKDHKMKYPRMSDLKHRFKVDNNRCLCKYGNAEERTIKYTKRGNNNEILSKHYKL